MVTEHVVRVYQRVVQSYPSLRPQHASSANQNCTARPSLPSFHLSFLSYVSRGEIKRDQGSCFCRNKLRTPPTCRAEPMGPGCSPTTTRLGVPPLLAPSTKPSRATTFLRPPLCSKDPSGPTFPRPGCSPRPTGRRSCRNPSVLQPAAGLRSNTQP